MRIFFAIVLGALLFSITSPARATIRTGSFDTTIVFMDTTRLLACYVPTTYTDTNEYRLMICLHGLGDNSG
ncbi:MAG TPA: hypothetical protein VG537_07530, partial [Candidatus Kapabacteria bacterium]|nr:hypothetical protein [Candidatus Kapabacteria bacterium]